MQKFLFFCIYEYTKKKLLKTLDFRYLINLYALEYSKYDLPIFVCLSISDKHFVAGLSQNMM